ncbi:uncharacterized protein LOC127281599 isoform X1 [Leptopilina boulardi]|uniref:uncharacterized protein LOC127281599 isoform X1 n=1 Tax=Leptopilina boulardi TaxID=63433 RepID=UPI0021F5CB2C|nr:uncharacterized protein LOC127281599 isoform X1 [Leptopilina boulardi]
MNVNNIFILFILSVVINNYQLITAQPDDDDIEKKYDPGIHCIGKDKIKILFTESSEVSHEQVKHVNVDYYFCPGKYHGYLKERMAKKYCIDKNNRNDNGSYMCRPYPFIWNRKPSTKNFFNQNDHHSMSCLKVLKKKTHFKKSSEKNPDDVDFTGYYFKDEAIAKCISTRKVYVHFYYSVQTAMTFYFCYGNKHIYRWKNDALQLCINHFSNNKYKCKIHPGS